MFPKIVKTFGVALSLATLFVVSAVATPAMAAVQIQQWTLPSGVRVAFVETHALPIVDIQIDVPAGSAYAPADKAGLAGMVAGMLDAGTAALDENALADRFADLGAQFGANAETDRASVSLRVLSSAAERDAAVDLVASVVGAPVFPEAVLTRERARAIAGLQEAETQPGYLTERTFMAEIYPGHPYGVSATKATLEGITRDDLVRFHQRQYAAAGAHVSIVGDLSREEADHIARRITGQLPQGQPPEALPAPSLPAAHTVRVTNPSAQAHIAIGMPGLRRDDPDYYALVTGNYVLGGGGFVSRLMKEVREKRGFAYSVYSYFEPQAVAGPFRIGLQTRGRQTDAAIEVVRDTLAKFIAQGPTPEELKAAQANIVNGFGLRIDSNAKLLGYVAVIGYYGLPADWLEAYPRAVSQLTVEQVRDAFRRRVQPDHLVTVIVGGDGDRRRVAAETGPAR
ncbi:insulinase family protein [Nitrogeniibacter mangrovi]|uniref:Insulinase family protein n=1 Tax=Nitrogeniibacter mangrovi TaxID=2016596 RepID=A0A6C1B5C2_9RHOO|nr:pitrilysin family protein [Nitrogeniibacter mangrovi]QID18891.1 insulinase family protein [Nitrogeniibacter mangrovi]